ncbi:MAG TPA: DUF397 domain-containing protein [Streptosporangiaceae bacterium]|nr:DUF397 domain-containing protein [Streptosporangiaceae bacterium]
MTETRWRKSTYSSGQGGQCVEVASTPGHVAVRDTKDNGNGPVLQVTPANWSRLMQSLKQ